MHIVHEAAPVTEEQEDLMLEAVRLRPVTDWEGLMEAHVTPALVLGGERRLHRKSSTATKRAS